MTADDSHLLPSLDCRWQDWLIPIDCQNVTLQSALDSAGHIAAKPEEIPLIIRLCENPTFEIPGFGFEGAVTLQDHDCIHALLGRGLLSKDEAFVIGFTMGSTNRISTAQEKIFQWAARYLYPKNYRFDDEDIHIFKDALRLGFISDCQPLNRVDYQTLTSKTLRDIRSELGIEVDLLKAYYRIETRRYEKSKASQRLLRAN